MTTQGFTLTLLQGCYVRACVRACVDRLMARTLIGSGPENSRKHRSLPCEERFGERRRTWGAGDDTGTGGRRARQPSGECLSVPRLPHAEGPVMRVTQAPGRNKNNSPPPAGRGFQKPMFQK